MYDISKRKELKNATVDDILKILQELPKDSKVFFNGDEHGYIHMEKDLSVVSFDNSSLDDDYYYDGQWETSRLYDWFKWKENWYEDLY